MTSKSRRSRGPNRFLGRTGDYVALGLIAVAAIALAVVAMSGVTLRPGATVVPTSQPAKNFGLSETATPTPTPTAEPSVVVSLIGDPTTAAAGSWWARSVGSALVPNALAGATITAVPTTVGEPVSVAALQQALETNATLGGVVIAQAGAAEAADAASTASVVTSVQALWQGVIDRGAKPVAALLEPSDDSPERVIEINSAITAAAAEAGVPVLDLHTPVASVEGGWATGLSDDGATPNAVGAETLAQAAIAQLPALLTAASPVTPPVA